MTYVMQAIGKSGVLGVWNRSSLKESALKKGLALVTQRVKLQSRQWRRTISAHHRYLATSSNSVLSKQELSYSHNPGTAPLIGKTIGQIMDETTEKFPDRDAHIFLRDGIRRTFEELREESECKAVVCARTFRTLDYYSMLREICPELDTGKPGQLDCAKLPDLQTVIFRGEDNLPGTFNFPDLLKMGGGTEETLRDECKNRIQFDEPINIQFTSGTTGFPKGVTLTHHNIVNNAFNIGQTVGYHEKHHRICVSVPLYHCFGMVGASLCGMVHGATCVFPSPGFEAGAALQAVATERCTSLYGTPTMFIDYLHHPRLAELDVSSLSTGIMGGSPCPIETMKQCMTRLNMKDVSIIYGLTETSAVITQTLRDDPVEERVSTVGKAAPHTELKIIDPQTGEIVPRNTSGELCSRGYATMIGYWNNQVKTDEAIDKARWFHTGDIAVMTEEGYVSIVGRNKDMIIRGGENIYPAEIENFLYKHPKINGVQVIGVPDERLGEIVCAWVKLKEGQTATEDDIRDFCKGEMAHFKIPKIVHFVSEFPLTVTGKVQKFKMLEEMVRIMGIK